MSVSNSLAAILLAAAPTPPAEAAPAVPPSAPAPMTQTVADQATVATPAVVPAEVPVAAEQAVPVPVPALVDPVTAGIDAASATGAVAAPAPADGTIIVKGRKNVPEDPLVGVNATSYEVVQAVDQAVIEPVAHGYMEAVPHPLRSGLHNVLNNLDEPIVFVNFLLQLKPGKAIETVGRFAINSTLGIGGLMDVAKKKPFNLPRRFNGMADTLGYYGVGQGPYLFLPLIGSTTLRDGLGRLVDLSILPTGVGKPFTIPAVSLGKAVLSSLDDRVEMDPQIKRNREAGDPYVAQRRAYLKRRQAEIDVLRGKLPLEALDGDYGVVTEPPAPAASATVPVVTPAAEAVVPTPVPPAVPTPTPEQVAPSTQP